MPHLNVNVNGKKYSISGLTRKTCTKQILCALAKINADSRVIKSHREPRITSSSSDESPSDDFEVKKRGQYKTSGENPSANGSGRRKSKLRLERHLHETRRKATNGDSRQERESTRRQEDEKKARSNTISSSMENLLSLVKVQRKCLREHQEKLEHKDTESAIRQCLRQKDKTVLEFHRTFNGSFEEKADPVNLKLTSTEFAEDTDHDTGISELYSDSSNEINTTRTACSSESAKDRAILSANREKSDEYASKIFYTGHIPKPAMHDALQRDQSKQCANNLSLTAESPRQGRRTKSSGSHAMDLSEETASGEYEVESRDRVFREMHRVMEGLVSTEAKVAEQSKLIEVLKTLTLHVENSAKEQKAQAETTRENVQEEIGNVRRSLSLSINLYEYQKQEILANTVKLQQVESKISRKRWHMESLLQELNNNRLSPTRGRPRPDTSTRRRAAVETGTLV